MKVIMIAGLLVLGLIFVIINRIKARRDQFINLGSRFDELDRRI